MSQYLIVCLICQILLLNMHDYIPFQSIQISQLNLKMGNVTHTDLARLQSLNYQIVSSEQDITYLIDKSHNKHLVLRNYHQPHNPHSLKGTLQNKKRLFHQHIAVMKDYQILGDNTARVLFELPFRTLEDEREQRIQNNIQFQSNELWSILASLILGYGYLQRNNVLNGAVRTNNIYLQDNGTIRIADPWIKGIRTNYQAFQVHQPCTVYLSPIQIQQATRGMSAITHNAYKTDVFSLGIVMLDLALLQRLNDIYVNGRVDGKRLASYIEACKNKHGKELAGLIQVMTQDQDQRLDWIGLEEFVKNTDGTDERQRQQQLPVNQARYIQCTQSTNVKTVTPQQQLYQTQPAQSYYPPPHMVMRKQPTNRDTPKQYQPATPTHHYNRPPIQKAPMATPPRNKQSNYSVIQVSHGLKNHSRRSSQKGQSPASSQHTVQSIYLYPNGQQIFNSKQMLQYQPKIQTPSQHQHTHHTGVSHKQQTKGGVQHVPVQPTPHQPQSPYLQSSMHYQQQSAVYQNKDNVQLFHAHSNIPRQGIQQNVASNRILATNINRERRSTSPVSPSKKSGLQPSPSHFARKIPAQPLPQHSHTTSVLQQRANSLATQINFTYKNNSAASEQHRIFTADATKRTLQRQHPSTLGDKMTPINNLIAVQDRPPARLTTQNLFQKKPQLPRMHSHGSEHSALKGNMTPPANFYSPSKIKQPEMPAGSASSMGTIMEKLQKQMSTTEPVVQQKPKSHFQYEHAEANKITGGDFGLYSDIRQQVSDQYAIKDIFREAEQPQEHIHTDIKYSQDIEQFNRPVVQQENQSYSRSNYDSLLQRYSQIKNTNTHTHNQQQQLLYNTESQFKEPQQHPKTHQAISVQVQTTPYQSNIKKKQQSSKLLWNSNQDLGAFNKSSKQIGKKPVTEPTKKSNTKEISSYGHQQKHPSTTIKSKQQHCNVGGRSKEVLNTQPKYQGQELKGFRHGQGKYIFEDGSYYQGHWNFNRMQGQGKLHYASGKLAYQGNWQQDQIHGHGKLYNEHPRHTDTIDFNDLNRAQHYWVSYQGQFESDQKHGQGTLTFCNGQSFSGTFVNDKATGEGIFQGKTGTVYGQWHRNKLTRTH